MKNHRQLSVDKISLKEFDGYVKSDAIYLNI